MRTYGRITDEYGNKSWVVVTTDANGFNDAVWITTLAQVLKLNLGESPFYANYGIPAHTSVVQQIFPDYYVMMAQRQFSPYFAALLVAKQPGPIPKYTINVTTQQGYKINASVPVPI